MKVTWCPGPPRQCGMEAPEPTCPALPARDQPASTPGPPGAPGGQASPRLTLGPVILPPEQGLAPTLFLKALPIPLYHTVPPGGLQPRAPLVTGSLEGGSMPFILSPLLPPEGPGPSQRGKPAAPTLTVNIVGALPVLSPGLGPTLGSPGKVRNAGKHLCPHCGRDCLKPSVLEKHIRSHTGERPFPCATCGVAFKTQSNLYKHRRTQTHLNHARLCSGSGASGLLEEGDRTGEPTPAAGLESQSQTVGLGSEGPPSSPGTKTPQSKTEAIPCPGPDREAFSDARHTACATPLQAGTEPWRKLPEQKSPTLGRLGSLQRQQATASASEKPWDAKAAEGRLRKCESTDSGYLSRSDSAEQPQVPASPLHSLSEHSAESEGEGGPGPGSVPARAEPVAPGASLELEKKRLEERIAQLISHNRAVVEDLQLDTVRPRKTVLSKQGSIDLPLPYTYKDSFHFDIRAPEPGRRRAALGPARSACAPLDKSRPLFFHSVPTQLSTTVECVPVTRSNSLPFLEGCRTWPEPRVVGPRTQRPLSPRPVPARWGCRSGLSLAVPSAHPRALVRQSAVEDLPATPTGDGLAPAEGPDGKAAAVGDGAAGRAGRKGCPRRQMFTQEKWQVYGKETFRRIYQKAKASHQGDRKAREARASSGQDAHPPPEGAAAAGQGTGLATDRRTSVSVDVSVGAVQGPLGGPPTPRGANVTECPKQREPVARAGGGELPTASRAGPSPTLGGRGPPWAGSQSPLLPPNRGLGPGRHLPPVPGPLKGADLEVPRPILPDPGLEGGAHGGGDVKETCPWAQTVPRLPNTGSGEPHPVGDKLPSEKKKPKVEELGDWLQSEPLGAETPGGHTQTSSPLLSPKQDRDLREMPGTLRGRGGQAEPPGSTGAPSVAASVASRLTWPKDKEPASQPVASGCRSQQDTQPGAPGTPSAAPADRAFSPKYLLRLPQGETPAPLPAAQGPREGRDWLCGRGQPEEQASFARPGLGSPLSPGPASGPAPSEADSISEDVCRPRPWEGRKGEQVGGDEGGRLDTDTPEAGESPGSALRIPRGTASLPPTPTCDTRMAQGAGGQTLSSHHLCMGRPSGGVLTLWASSGELGRSPRKTPEEPRSGPLAGLKPCCPFQLGSFLPPFARPQDTALGQPELASAPHAGTPRGSGPQSSFPSLRAEPRLTWCCLSRSLPLPLEQEKAASLCGSLHPPGGNRRGEGPEPPPGSSTGWTKTRPGDSGLAQTSKLSHPVLPGVTSQDPGSEPELKKRLPRRRAKTSRGNSKQKKLRIAPKRSKSTGRAPWCHLGIGSWQWECQEGQRLQSSLRNLS
ncbi:zinc finger protein 831 isoform X1 [Tupaia chinensis]|uniref:zinc finger protein 831 isoform X1 n=1 Tax=Tupaia chinensis TaxID=246437 RepID=UPI000FFC86D2|nr:zinc finger protein 831 isoform X1 [Tupaia chinensis]